MKKFNFEEYHRQKFPRRAGFLRTNRGERVYARNRKQICGIINYINNYIDISVKRGTKDAEVALLEVKERIYKI